MDRFAKSYKGLVRSAWRLFSLSHRAWGESMAEAGLSTSTFPLLESIVRKPGISQQEIADDLSIDKSCSSRGCRFLESKGFIRREKSQLVAHGFLCYPTEKGLKVCEEVISKEEAKIHEIFGGAPPEDMEKAADLLQQLLQDVQS